MVIKSDRSEIFIYLKLRLIERKTIQAIIVILDSVPSEESIRYGSTGVYSLFFPLTLFGVFRFFMLIRSPIANVAHRVLRGVKLSFFFFVIYRCQNSIFFDYNAEILKLLG